MFLVKNIQSGRINFLDSIITENNVLLQKTTNTLKDIM